MRRTDFAAMSLITSRLFGGMAMQFLVVYGFYKLYKHTGSPLQVGLFGFAFFLPTLIFTFLAGQRADRIREVGRDYVVIQGLILATSVALLLGTDSVLLLYGAAFALSCLRTIRTPVFYSVLLILKNEGLDATRMVRAMAFSWQLPLVLSPALFSLLATRAPWISPAWVIAFFCALSFCASVPLWTARKPSASTPARDATLIETVRTFLRTPVLARPLLADAAVMTFLAFISLLPFFLGRNGMPPEDIGFLRAAIQGGSLAATLLLPRRLFESSRHGVFALTLIALALLTFTLPFCTSPTELYLVCGALGILDGLSTLYRDSLLLQFASSATIGRFSALQQILISLTDDFGETRAGAFAEVLGPAPAVIVGALCGLFFSFVYAWKADVLPGSWLRTRGKAFPFRTWLVRAESIDYDRRVPKPRSSNAKVR